MKKNSMTPKTMKQKWPHSRALALGLFLLLPFLGIPLAVQAADYDAVPFSEGEMTEYGPSGLPIGWSVPEWGKSAFSHVVEGDETFLAITWPHVGYLYPTCVMEVDPSWQRIRVAAQVRIAEVQLNAGEPGGVMMRISFLDESGNLIRLFDSVTVDLETDSTEFSVEADVPENAMQLQIDPGFYMAAGALDINRVTLSAAWRGSGPGEAAPARVIAPESQTD